MNRHYSATGHQLLDELDEHFQDIRATCPYGLPHTAIYRMARFSHIPEGLMGLLLAKGFRRYGNTIYTMRCENCRSCVPIRIDPFEFSPNRNQKRTICRNQDLSVEAGPLNPDEKTIRLLQDFFASRYPGSNNTARDYYAGFFLNSSGFSMEIRYHSGNKLIGVSVIDLGSTWLNAVYFFFDPESSKSSPGTFNILNLIRICREQNIRELYLGYWIKESAAMNYKASFLPHFLLDESGWTRVSVTSAAHTP